MLKSKLHRATVTDANVDYEGSISLDPALMEAADILPYEQVHVLDVNSGSRLTTYAIEGKRNSGAVCVNGAAAHLVKKGDLVIILAYATVRSSEAPHTRPRLVYLNEHNQVMRRSLDGRMARARE